jgi:hypothetical protein
MIKPVPAKPISSRPNHSKVLTGRWHEDPKKSDFTHDEFKAWLRYTTDKHRPALTAPRQPIPGIEPDRRCRWCEGRGASDVRWIGWVRCSRCHGDGREPMGEARGKRATKAK